MARLPTDVQSRIDVAIRDPGQNPRPPRCRRLSGREDERRIGVGGYRLVYEIHDDSTKVLVLAWHRQKGLPVKTEATLPEVIPLHAARGGCPENTAGAGEFWYEQEVWSLLLAPRPEGPPRGIMLFPGVRPDQPQRPPQHPQRPHRRRDSRGPARPGTPWPLLPRSPRLQSPLGQRVRGLTPPTLASVFWSGAPCRTGGPGGYKVLASTAAPHPR